MSVRFLQRSSVVAFVALAAAIPAVGSAVQFRGAPPGFKHADGGACWCGFHQNRSATGLRGGGGGPTGLPDASVAVIDGLVHLELGPNDLIPAHLNDLEGRTVRFTPTGTPVRYIASTQSLIWESDFGDEITDEPSAQVDLTDFAFPFSGSSHDTCFVGLYGNITFGADQNGFYDFSRDRFLRFRTYPAARMIGDVPIISPLFHKFSTSDFDSLDAARRFVRRFEDRLIVTWQVSDPYDDVFDFISEPQTNLFQCTLHADGRIDFSYHTVAVDDGVVGVFPLESSEESFLATITDPVNSGLPAHIDLRRITISRLGESRLRITFQTRGSILPEGNSTIDSLFYRLWVDTDEPLLTGVDFGDADMEWTVGSFSGADYVSFGPGVTGEPVVNGNTISIMVNVAALSGATRFACFADAADFDAFGFPFDQTGAVVVNVPAPPEQLRDLSAATGSEPPSTIIYEAFHHADVPDETELAAAVISRLGDDFDFLAFFTDMRLDRQEAGAVSSGGIGESVSGLGHQFADPASFGSAGRLQCLQHALFIGAPIAAPQGNDIRGPYSNYNRQVALLAHELGHRWLSLAQADPGSAGAPLDISDPSPHWLDGLHAPAAHPVDSPNDASPMGGSSIVDRGDGTFLFRNSGFFHASGYSPLDLYAMGLLPADEVPPFFLVENAGIVDFDFDEGFFVYSGVRTDLTIDDVIAVTGVRLPAFENSQRMFRLGTVIITANGDAPSQLLKDRAAGIRSAFRSYWTTATGGISSMVPAPDEPSECPCDWNMADGLDSQDFFDFLTDFFDGNADINGVDGTDSQDYFDFLECFFIGCP